MSKIQVSGQPVILFAEECDRGTLRKESLDSALHVQIALGDLMIVADGIGGDAGGATASRMVVEQFYTHMAALPGDYSVGSAIRESAARANAAILSAAQAPGARHPRMSSTVVAALVQQTVDGTHAWIGHIGDSRAYLVRAGRLHQLTTDNSAVQSLISRNLIAPQEARRQPDSSVLARSLGHQPEVEIDIEQHPLAAGDTLLLCSDGLWGFVSEQEILKVTDNIGLTVETAARNLLELALAAGGHDNIGIAMARLIQPPDLPAQKSENYIPIKLVLALLLLAIATLGALAFILLRSN
jgi:protein phosphatase